MDRIATVSHSPTRVVPAKRPITFPALVTLQCWHHATASLERAKRIRLSNCQQSIQVERHWRSEATWVGWKLQQYKQVLRDLRAVYQARSRSRRLGAA